MKLTILTQYFIPEMGAPQSRLFELAKGMQARGWDLSIVTAMPNYPHGKIFSGYRGKFSVTEQADNMQVRRYWLYASNSSRPLPRILSMLSFSATALCSVFYLRRKKPHFILVESPPLTLAFSGWLLSKLTGARLIMNVSDIWPLSAKELGAISDGIVYRALEKLEKFLYDTSFVCQGQSDEIVKHIRARTTRHVRLFRNGVDTRRFRSTTIKPSQSKIPRVVYAGLLGVAQNVLAVCRNVDFRQIGVEFHIYGSGPQKNEIEEFIGAHPDRNIFYHGTLNREEVPAVLMSYEATIIPLTRHIYGAVPSKIYEALAAGLPIFFSGDGEGAQIVKENRVGYTSTSGDWRTLSENLTDYSKASPQVQEELRNQCRKIAAEKFDRDFQIEALHQYLKNTISHSNGR